MVVVSGCLIPAKPVGLAMKIFPPNRLLGAVATGSLDRLLNQRNALHKNSVFPSSFAASRQIKEFVGETASLYGAILGLLAGCQSKSDKLLRA
jgi:tRNA A37 methylthiotransferase MiaB